MEYYTYIHTKPNGDIFYVGKGKGQRATSKHGRNPHWKNVVNKYGYKIEYLIKKIDEELSLLCEIEAIDVYLRRGHSLVNKTSGGENPTWKLVSLETKAKMSLAQKGKKMSEEAKQKISLSHFGNNNPQFKGAILAVKLEDSSQKIYVGNKQLEADGFDNTRVYNCVNGSRKTHKGHTFERLGEYHR
jgi:hypothetical protein